MINLRYSFIMKTGGAIYLFSFRKLSALLVHILKFLARILKFSTHFEVSSSMSFLFIFVVVVLDVLVAVWH